MEVLEAIFKRRSIRHYQEQTVPRELLVQLLESATAAPTAANCQPWEFVVIESAEGMAALREVNVYGRYNAPHAIVVMGNMELALKGPDHEMWVQDCSAAMENMMLAAIGLGLGTVWIGVYPVPSRVKAIQKLLHAPEHAVPLGIMYVGYPAEEKEPRHRLDMKRVYFEGYEPERKHRSKDKPKIGHY